MGISERSRDFADVRILELLQKDGRMSNADIARDLGMAPSAVLERIRKLEERGTIQGFEARLSPKTLGLGLTTFIFVRAEDHGAAARTGEQLGKIPGVQEVHQIAGEDCYLVKLRTRDTEELAQLLNRRLKTIPGIQGTRTTIVLSTIKETALLPLDHLGKEAAAKEREKP